MYFPGNPKRTFPELCVELAGAVVTQTEIREKLASIQKQLAEGYGFTEAITESGLFKAMELRLISLGFQAGASDEVMENWLSSMKRNPQTLFPTLCQFWSLLL